MEPKEELCNKVVSEATNCFLPFRRKLWQSDSATAEILSQCSFDKLDHWKQRQCCSVNAVGSNQAESRICHISPTSSQGGPNRYHPYFFLHMQHFKNRWLSEHHAQLPISRTQCHQEFTVSHIQDLSLALLQCIHCRFFHFWESQVFNASMDSLQKFQTFILFYDTTFFSWPFKTPLEFSPWASEVLQVTDWKIIGHRVNYHTEEEISDSLRDCTKGKVQVKILVPQRRHLKHTHLSLQALPGVYYLTPSLKASSEINWGTLQSYQQRQTKIWCQVTSSDEERNLCGFQPACTSSEETPNSPVWLMKPCWTKQRNKK